MTTTCRSCDAPILFVPTRAKRSMPVDATIAVENEVARDSSITFEELREKLGADAVVSHFSTCSDPDRFRRAR